MLPKANATNDLHGIPANFFSLNPLLPYLDAPALLH